MSRLVRIGVTDQDRPYPAIPARASDPPSSAGLVSDLRAWHRVRAIATESADGAGSGPAGPRSPISCGARWIRPGDDGSQHSQPAEATGPAGPLPAPPANSRVAFSPLESSRRPPGPAI